LVFVVVRKNRREGQRVNLHASEYGAKVVFRLGSVGKTAVGRAEGQIAVGATGTPLDAGAVHFLNRTDGRESPEVGVSDPRELLCCVSVNISMSDPL